MGGGALGSCNLPGGRWAYSPETLLATDKLSQCWSWREAEMEFSPRRRRACGYRRRGTRLDCARSSLDCNFLPLLVSFLLRAVLSRHTSFSHQPSLPTLLPHVLLAYNVWGCPTLGGTWKEGRRQPAQVPRTEVNSLPEGREALPEKATSILMGSQGWHSCVPTHTHTQTYRHTETHTSSHPPPEHPSPTLGSLPPQLQELRAPGLMSCLTGLHPCPAN